MAGQEMQKCFHIYEAFMSLCLSVLIVSAFVGTSGDYILQDNKYVINSNSGCKLRKNPKCVSSICSNPKINVGIIVMSIESREGLRFKTQFVELIKSILNKTNTKMHFVLLSDTDSIRTLLRIMKKIALKYKERTCLTYEFFNVSTIVGQFKDEITHLKLYFTSKDYQAQKYSEDLFMIAPFLHQSLPFRHFIMLDVDLFFRTDIKDLYLTFDLFSETEAVALSLDLAPHYYHVLRFYRDLNPGTQVGLPGRFQGLNTGVALYNLAHLRTHAKFNEYIAKPIGRSPSVLDQLATKFYFKSHLGDQCFFTLLSLEHPEFFRVLDCGYNFQLDKSMFRDPWESLFPAYHNCTSKPKVYHMNGGSETPNGARILSDL